MNKALQKINKNGFWENAYLLVLGIYIAIDVLNTTMFKIQWPEKIGYIQYAIIGGYGLAKFIYCIKKKLYSMWEIVLTVAIVVVFTIVAVITTSYSYLFPIAFLIIGAKDVDFDKILKVYIIVVITIILAAVLTSQIGIIENLRYVDHRGTRNSMGIIYPTDFGAHIFYLALAWICYRNEKITWCELFIICIIAIIVYYLSMPVTSMACIILMLILSAFEKEYRKIEKNIVLRKIRDCFLQAGKYSVIFFSAIYMFVQHMYNPESLFWHNVDDKISYRLMYTWYTLYDKTAKWFGQDIMEIGYGGNEDTSHDYMFLDDSYISILMKYGIIVFALVLLIFIIGQYKALKNQRFMIILAGITLSLHSIMEHHFLEIGYNPFVLIIFASFINENRERNLNYENRNLHQHKRSDKGMCS